ncbi:MAG: hypothetical protein HYU80_04030 [Candidatus Blackburnbacteria bacterium]|nr:hypothetical protein [Candidatus Blackburnbacteria bacterium]
MTPERTEAGQTPEGILPIVWKKDMFPPTSFGSVIFPSALEGCERPSQTLAVSIERFAATRRQHALLRQNGITQIAELMATDAEKLDVILGKRSVKLVKDRVLWYLEDLALGPDGSLIATVFSSPKIPIPQRFEGKQRAAVLAALSKLQPREAEILAHRFGLDSGLTKTSDQVGGIYRVTGERIRQIEAKAIRKLRYPTRMGKLWPFVALTEGSIGTNVFGVNFPCEFDERFPNSVGRPLEDLHLVHELLPYRLKVRVESDPDLPVNVLLDYEAEDVHPETLAHIGEQVRTLG